MTAKADAKKRAKPRAATRAASPRQRAHQSETAAGEEESSDESSTDSDEQEPEVLGDERAVFDTEAEVVDPDEVDPEEEREPAEEVELSEGREREIDGDSDERGLARFDPLQAYMREVQRHPLLSADEEHKLAVQYLKTEDREVAARLVTANLRWW